MTLTISLLGPHAVVRAPDPERSTFEAELVRRNAHDRERAAARVEQGLGSAPAAAARASGPGQPEPWPVAPGLVAALAQGRSSPGAAAGLAEDLAHVFQARVGRPVPVPVHEQTDLVTADHDTLVVPAGSPVAVELAGPTVASPVPGVGLGGCGPVAWKGAVDPGTALLVPRGWGHRLEPEADHPLVLAVRRRRGTDVVAAIARLAGGEEAFREEVPWDPAALPPRPGSIFGAPHALAAALDDLRWDRLRAAARSWWQASLSTDADPDVHPPDRPGTRRAPGGVQVVERRDPDDLDPALLRVGFGGRVVVGPPDEVEVAVLDADRGQLGADLAWPGGRPR